MTFIQTGGSGNLRTNHWAPYGGSWLCLKRGRSRFITITLLGDPASGPMTEFLAGNTGEEVHIPQVSAQSQLQFHWLFVKKVVSLVGYHLFDFKLEWRFPSDQPQPVRNL